MPKAAAATAGRARCAPVAGAVQSLLRSIARVLSLPPGPYRAYSDTVEMAHCVSEALNGHRPEPADKV